MSRCNFSTEKQHANPIGAINCTRTPTWTWPIFLGVGQGSPKTPSPVPNVRICSSENFLGAFPCFPNASETRPRFQSHESLHTEPAPAFPRLVLFPPLVRAFAPRVFACLPFLRVVYQSGSCVFSYECVCNFHDIFIFVAVC